MSSKTQQIALDLDPDERTRLEPPFEPERVRKVIALMVDAIVTLVEPMGRQNNDDD